MKSRPTIFLSGVSCEFGSFRDAVENEVEMKGCFAENQPGFPPDYRSVEAMLTEKIRESDVVICIVGFLFGAEPNQRPDGVPRRSWASGTPRGSGSTKPSPWPPAAAMRKTAGWAA